MAMKLSRAPSFWLLATLLAFLLFAASSPSPLYVVYEAKWHFSSDEMVPGAVNGSTFHVDYWEAWSPTVKTMWTNGCINLHLSCGGAGLGNGQTIRGGDMPWPNGFPKHQLVAVPN